MTAQIEWQPERNMSCFNEDDLRTYGHLAGREVAMVKYEDYVSKYGDKEHVTGWSHYVYLKPWPRSSNEDLLKPTKEAAQAACQEAVNALHKLLETGEADPAYEWI